MAGRDLASLASGLSETFFGGLAEKRRTDQEQKDKELSMQLAAYHSLLNSDHTPLNAIPDIQDAMAKLLKAEKDFAPISEQIRQAIAQHSAVPDGEERETLDSRVSRAVAESSAPSAMVSTTNAQPTYRPVPTIEGGLGPYTPPSFTPPAPSAPITVETPALRSVPMGPEMYQPTRAYGELSQGEAKDFRETQAYTQKQGAMLERQSALAEAAEVARQARMDDQQAATERAIGLRAEEARKTQDQLFENKVKMLPLTEQSKARLRVNQIASSLPVGLPQEERDRQARQLAMGEIQVAVDQKKQQIATSKASMERMGILNRETFERIRKSKEGTGLTQGLSTAAAREYNLRTDTLQRDLGSTLSQLDAAYKKAAEVSKVAGIWDRSPEKAEVDRLEAKKSDLWGKIDSVRNELLNRGSGGGVSRVPLSPDLEQRIRDAAAAKGLDGDIAVQRARARQ